MILNYFTILHLSTIFITTVFIFFLLSKAKKTPDLKAFVLLLLLVLLWFILEFFAIFADINPKIFVFLWNIVFVVVTIMGLALFRFISIFLNLKINRIFAWALSLAITIFAIYVIYFSGEFIIGKSPDVQDWGYNYIRGDYYFIIVSFVFGPMLASLILLLKKITNKKIKKEKINQIKYLLFGLFIAVICGSITNLFLPLLNIDFPKIANVAVVMMLFIWLYSIYKYRIFGIELAHLKIKNKIFIVFFGLSILIISILIGIFYFLYAHNLEQLITAQLKIASSNKKEELVSYLKERQGDIAVLSHSPSLQEILTLKKTDAALIAKEKITKKAQAVSAEINNYIKANPEKTIFDLQNDKNFQKIAVQPVGKSGYTAVTDYDTLINRFHTNPKIVNLDLHELAEKLPTFWNIMSRTEGGHTASGYYDWREADGNLKEKYMYIDIVKSRTADNVGLSVAATTYLDEYGPEIKVTKQSEDYLQTFIKSYGYKNLLLINTEGEILWQAVEKEFFLGQNLNSQKYNDTKLQAIFQNVLQTKQISLSDFDIEKNTKKYLLYIAAPVFDVNRNILGVAIFQINDTSIKNILQKDLGLLNVANETYLLSKNNYIISPNNLLSNIQINPKISNYCFNASSSKTNHAANSHVFDYVNHQKANVLGISSLVPQTNWCLVLEINKKEVLAPLQRILIISLVILIASVLLVYVVAKWIGGVISKPIIALQEDIKIIQSGNLDHKTAIKTKDEIGDLSRSFDAMTNAIKKSRASIDKKVKEQTTEIIKKQKMLKDQQKAVLNVLEDVEEEKNNVASERDKIDAILHSIGDAVFAINHKMQITMFNEIAENISGYKQAEVIGKDYKKILKFVNEKDGKINDAYIAKVIKTGESQKMPHNINLVKKNGEQVAVDDTASPLRDKDGNIKGAVIVFRDVEKERAIDKAKTEFVSLASHQLRTPLTSINWYTEMILSGDAGKVTADQKKYLEEIYKGNQRMVTLVNSLLNVSRLELGTFAIEPKIVNIKKLAEQEIKALLPQTRKKNIKITTNYSDGIDKYKADPRLLAIIFQNLLSNAVKYNNEGGKVDLKIAKRKYDILITVSDNGYGIPKKQHKNIFTKLFRADNVRQMDTEGTGLGLYIIKEIVDQVGGSIKFDSVEGKGTTFYVSLPLEGMKKKEGAKTLE